MAISLSHRRRLTALALAAFVWSAPLVACETEIDPPNLADDCYSRSVNALPFWGTISLPRTGAGLASTGSLAVGMTVTRLPIAVDTSIARVKATMPNLGTIANSSQVNEDQSTWMELMLRADPGAGPQWATLEWVHYGYINSRIVPLASASSGSFALQNTHQWLIGISFDNGTAIARVLDPAASKDSPPIVQLSAAGFGTTPPWIKVRWGAQNPETGLASVQVNPDAD
jgi:hypothetical protein